MSKCLTAAMMNATLALGLVVSIGGTARADRPSIVVTDAWSRPATGTAVVYATIRNRSSVPDRLVGATSPQATRVELHESSAKKPPGVKMMMDGMTMPAGSSMMTMRSLSSIDIPALGTASLEPGGYHLMLDLRHDLRAGDIVALRMHFARAGWIATRAFVRPIN